MTQNEKTHISQMCVFAQIRKKRKWKYLRFVS